MEPWLSHSLTSVGGFAAGAFLLWRRWRAQTVGEWQQLYALQQRQIVQQAERIAALERKVEDAHGEHARCLAEQAALRAEIALLKAQLAARAPA